MDKICCIVLNYNDASTTLSLTEELMASRLLTDLVVVDNCSTDDSWERLAVLKSRSANERSSEGGEGGKRAWGPAVHLLRTEKNGGYGAGNQAGIDYAMANLAPDYIAIANPDIHVSDRCIFRVKEALRRQENGAAASAWVKSPQGRRLFSYWDLLPMWKDLLDTEAVCRRIFRPWLITPVGRLPRGDDEKSRIVGALPGSFFMLKMSCFNREEAGNIFDKNIFLYYEEKVLARKLAARGLAELLVTDVSYIHAHSVSIDKSIRGMTAKQRLLHESKLYYYKTYLGAGMIKLTAARAFLRLVLAEAWLLSGGWRK